jgi:hypothetical protein
MSYNLIELKNTNIYVKYCELFPITSVPSKLHAPEMDYDPLCENSSVIV